MVYRQERRYFCIQETKAHREQLADELIEREGYSSYFAQAEKKGYSGVALWSRKNRKVQLIS